jgi:hypothetical protein
MIFTEHKKQFSRLLLVIYFLAYSISPISYTLPDKQVRGHIYATNKESSSIKSVHILLWEFFAEKLSSLEENSHDDGNASILIKKKRALTPEDASGKLSWCKITSVPKDCYNPLAPTTYSLNVPPANICGMYNGFNPLYAGNSPPFVYL